MKRRSEDAERMVRYEKTDLKPAAVARAGIVLALTTLLTAIGALGLFHHFAARDEAREAPLPPLARQEPNRQPPEPRLQAQPFVDIQALRAEEERILSSYGWVDEQKGIVRIPIERAMELIAERGLPSAVASPGAGRTSPALGARR